MDVSRFFSDPSEADGGLSVLARGVLGSQILRIAGEVRALKAKGIPVCNLTVGDFDPAFFPIPVELLEGTRIALAEGQTNYPPSDGVPALKEAIVRYYERELSLSYPVDSVLVASGARPLIYGAFRTLVDPGDTVVYPVPSWNNDNYCHLVGARAVEIPVHDESNFFPTVAQLEAPLRDARLLVLNSPLNPTGTVIAKEPLAEIARLVVAENRRRRPLGERPLYLLWDQVYWTLTFGSAAHHTPVGLVPEVAPFTLLLDAVSKSFCATGLRVGWGVMPPALKRRMNDILGHVGCWAPKPEQVATARLLNAPEETREFHARTIAGLRRRLDALHDGLHAMRAEGLPVDAIAPQGAIYLSTRVDLIGRTVEGRRIGTNEEIRRLLLDEAGIAVVPFQAFGLREETGWFRISVGAVSEEDIEAALPRLRALVSRATAGLPVSR